MTKKSKFPPLQIGFCYDAPNSVWRNYIALGKKRHACLVRIYNLTHSRNVNSSKVQRRVEKHFADLSNISWRIYFIASPYSR